MFERIYDAGVNYETIAVTEGIICKKRDMMG